LKQAVDDVAYDKDTAILLARNEHRFCIKTLKTGLKIVDLFQASRALLQARKKRC